jgi:hypothetical protein
MVATELIPELLCTVVSWVPDGMEDDADSGVRTPRRVRWGGVSKPKAQRYKHEGQERVNSVLIVN